MVFNEVLNAFLYDIIDKRKNSFAISRKAFNVPKHDLICTGTGLKNMNINHKCVDIRNSILNLHYPESQSRCVRFRHEVSDLS